MMQKNLNDAKDYAESGTRSALCTVCNSVSCLYSDSATNQQHRDERVML